ncbi:hypothetical protein CISIN_1g042043mg [Citrus sinensis]|uniref:Uncharacterized protein n=1 Tax=Citrus sinensis TaxID=2711 RepID=A0A067FDF0_CITSI|nr:hypothetical protein CISIN_1g042043mg [Citrus sinensis]
MPELLGENEKLRKENAQLNNELSQLKGLCNNILALMTNYASGQLDNVSLPEGKTVDELDLTPRLFGVSIGAKCARREEEEEQNQLQQQQGENEPGSDVKSEPLDANNDHHQEPPWLELGKS